jgi:hypothetical protein
MAELTTAASPRRCPVPRSEIASCAEGHRVHRGNPKVEITVYPAADKDVAGGVGAWRANTTGKCGPLHRSTSDVLPSAGAGAILDENAIWHAQPQLITSSCSNTKYFLEREDPESSVGQTTCFATR